MYGHSNSSQVTPNSQPQQIKHEQVILRVAPKKKEKRKKKKENQHTMPYTYTYKIQKKEKKKKGKNRKHRRRKEPSRLISGTPYFVQVFVHVLVRT